MMEQFSQPPTKKVPKLNKISFLFLVLIISVAFNFVLTRFVFSQAREIGNWEEPKIAETVMMPWPSASPLEVVSTATNSRYLELERLLLTEEQKDVQALSKLFGFKLKNFHKDWSCLNRSMEYTSEGVIITCEKKLVMDYKGWLRNQV